MILWGLLTFLRITGVKGSLPRSSGEVGNVIGGLKGTLQKTNRRNLLSNPSYTGPDDPTGELEIGSHADYPWYDNRVLHPISTSNLRGLSSCDFYSSYTDYQKSTAMNMCSLYGGNCASSYNEASGSGDDGYCAQRGFAFIGISFSVLDHDGENGCPNVNYYPDNNYHDNIDQSNNYGNPNSYALNNQLPLQCLLDRTYKYMSSSDIDGWLIGGGNHYEAFDGKMPYIDSSHTELLRIGSVDANQGGISMNDVYEFFDSIWLPPIRVYPTYFKGNNDMELKVNIWETYTGGEYCVDNDQLCGCPDSDGGEGDFEWFSDCILDNVAGESECADDDMTGPHISAIRGVKYQSDDHKDALLLSNNNQVMAWQDAYPEGVNLGTQATNIMFTDDDVSDYETEHGYGAMYFFFGRVAITKAFKPSRNLTETELAYSEFTLYNEFNSSDNYDASAIEYSGSNQEGGDYDCYDYNFWDSDYWDNMSGKTLPCNCTADGEAFLGIALAKHVQLGSTSAVNGGAYENFQNTFRLSQLTANMADYILGFDSNHATTVGLHYDAEENGFATIIEEDNAHIKLFPLGNLDPNYGGIDIADVISTVSKIKFSELVIKPAFVAIEANNGDVVLYWEMECNSAIGQLFNELAALLGNPIFDCVGVTDGSCGPSFSNSPQYFCAGPLMSDTCDAGCAWNATGPGSFCLQTTLMYAPIFQDDMAATYLTWANELVDSWRFESTILDNGTISSINYNSPIAATAMSSSIWAKGEKISNSGHKALCNGNAGCLTVFYNPMHPYASIPPCKGDGTVYYRSYYDAFGMASDNSDGDYNNQIDILTKTTDTVKVLMKGIVLITVSLIFSFSALIGYRKYSRRRNKGMSASEIIFGRASKDKRSRGGKKKKKKSSTERRSDKNKDRNKSPGRDKSRNRKSLDDGKKTAKKKKIKRKSVEDAQAERANKADAMVASLLRKQPSSSASNPYSYPNLTNPLSQSSRQYESPETYTIPNDVRGSPKGRRSSSGRNSLSRHDSYEHSTVERSSSGRAQYDTHASGIRESSPTASSTSYSMPDDDDSIVDKRWLKSISSSRSTSFSVSDRQKKSSSPKEGKKKKKKHKLERSRSREEDEIDESNTFLV